jgi:hypothetical protein
MKDRAKIRVKRHSEPEIKRLEKWCEEHSHSDREAVAVIGLSYRFGLNEHQIAAARLRGAADEITVEYPVARRDSEIRSAEWRLMTIDEPSWLVEAISGLGGNSGGPKLLLTPRRRVGTVSAGYVRKLASRAAAAATGFAMSCATLASTRAAEAAELKLPFALHERGYAASYLARLIDPKIETVKPRRRAA